LKESGKNGGNGTPDVIATVKRCLADILDLHEVEETKSFQDYGMNSISGMRFALLLEKRLKLQISPQWLMENPTTRALATRLAGEIGQGGVG
jgi:acyl carrier protein